MIRALAILLALATPALAQNMMGDHQAAAYGNAGERGCFHRFGRGVDRVPLERCLAKVSCAPADCAAIQRSQAAPWVDRAVDFNGIGTDAAKAMERCGPYGCVAGR